MKQSAFKCEIMNTQPILSIKQRYFKVQQYWVPHQQLSEKQETIEVLTLTVYDNAKCGNHK